MYVINDTNVYVIAYERKEISVWKHWVSDDVVAV